MVHVKQAMNMYWYYRHQQCYISEIQQDPSMWTLLCILLSSWWF